MGGTLNADSHWKKGLPDTDTDDGYLQPLAIEQLLKDSDGQHSCHSLESCIEMLLGMRNVKFLNHGPRRRNE